MIRLLSFLREQVCERDPCMVHDFWEALRFSTYHDRLTWINGAGIT